MKTLATLLAVVAGALLLSSSTPKPACARGYCGVAPCVNSSQCLSDCSCMRSGPALGRCVSFN